MCSGWFRIYALGLVFKVQGLREWGRERHLHSTKRGKSSGEWRECHGLRCELAPHLCVVAVPCSAQLARVLSYLLIFIIIIFIIILNI